MLVKILKKIMILTVICSAVFTSVAGCSGNVKITTGLKDDVIFKLSDSRCSLPEIMITLINEKNKYEDDFGTEIWNKTVAGKTMEDSVKLYVKERQIYLEAMYMFAQENGIEISEEENEKLAAAAEAYYSSLTDSEREKLKVSKEDIQKAYEKCLKAEKVYNSMTEGTEYEVSDEEARVMRVMYIYINTASEDSESQRAKAQEVFAKIQGGADFYMLADEYSDDDIIEIDIGRGDMVESVEQEAFQLKTGEYTDIIETEKGFYIVKCVEDYLPDMTESNKNEILQQVKNREFLEKFNPFLEKQQLDFNSKVWERISFSDYDDIDTDTLFDVYSEYMADFLQF